VVGKSSISASRWVKAEHIYLRREASASVIT